MAQNVPLCHFACTFNICKKKSILPRTSPTTFLHSHHDYWLFTLWMLIFLTYIPQKYLKYTNTYNTLVSRSHPPIWIRKIEQNVKKNKKEFEKIRRQWDVFLTLLTSEQHYVESFFRSIQSTLAHVAGHFQLVLFTFLDSVVWL